MQQRELIPFINFAKVVYMHPAGSRKTLVSYKQSGATSKSSVFTVFSCFLFFNQMMI